MKNDSNQIKYLIYKLSVFKGKKKEPLNKKIQYSYNY